MIPLPWLLTTTLLKPNFNSSFYHIYLSKKKKKITRHTKRHVSWVSCITVQFSSVAQSCPILWDPMDCSTPGLPVHHKLLEFTPPHVHWVGDAIQPSHSLSSPSLSAFNLSQHQGLFKWVCYSHHMAKVLEFQLQHQSFQWIFKADFL